MPTDKRVYSTEIKQQFGDKQPVNDFTIPARPAPETDLSKLPQPKPYLAQSVDTNGNPFYGGGFKGWVRETFADLFDPSKWNGSLMDLRAGSQIEQDLASQLETRNQQYIQAAEQNVNKYTHWDEWAQKFFGISAKDIGTAVADVASAGDAAKAKASAEGLNPSVESTKQFVAASARFFKDASQDLVLGGLQVLTGDDYVLRKAHAGNVAMQDLAQSVGVNVATGNAVADNIILAPVEDLINSSTVGLSLLSGKLDWETVSSKISNNLAGSEMAYTMLFDQTKRDQFNAEVAKGRDPALVAQELSSIGWEVAGSILGSPSTYLGVGIPGNFGKAETVVKIPFSKATLFKVPWEKVAEIPTFTKILGIEKAVGLGRIAQEANSFLGPDKEVAALAEKILNQADTLDNLGAGASKLPDATVQEATKFVKDTSAVINKWRNNYDAFSYMSTGKVAITIRDTQLALGHLLEISGGNVDHTLSLANDLSIVAKGNGDAEFAQALFRLAKSPLGGSTLNKNFILLGDVIGRVGDDFVKLAEKYGDQPTQFRKELVVLTQKVAEDLIPSVSDMAKAAEKVTKGGATEKEIALAEKYKQLVKDKPMVAWSQKLANKIDPTNSKIVGFQSTIFMGFSPRYFVRNIEGQFLSIAMNLGLQDALEISGSTFKGMSEAKTEAHLSELFGKIKELGGYVPEAAARGMGQAGKGGTGFLAKAQNAEKIASAEIVYRSMLKEIRSGVNIALTAPDPKTGASAWESVKAVLPREQTNYLGKMLKEYNGDWNKAFSEFEKVVGDGTIPAHRMTEIPDTLEKFLSDTGNLTKVEEIQRTATTQAEFESGVRAIIKDIQDKADFAKLDAPRFAEATVNGELGKYTDDLATAAESKAVDHATADIFTRKLEASRQLQDQLSMTVHRLNSAISAQMGAQGIDVTQFANQLATTETKYNSIYREVDGIRNVIVPKLKQKFKPQDIKDFWNLEIAYKDASGANQIFKLADIYPTMKPEALDYARMKDLTYKAYFDIIGNHFADTQLNRYGELLDILDAGAKQAGGSLDNFAQGVTSPSNPLVTLTKLKTDLQDIKTASVGVRNADIVAGQLNFAESLQGAARNRKIASIYGYSTASKEGQAIVQNDERLLKLVNDLGGEQFTSLEQVPSDLMKQAMENWAVSKGKISIKTLGDTKPAIDMRPPTTEGMSLAHGLSLNMDGATADFEKYINAVKNDWGKGVSTSAVDASKQLNELKKVYASRLVDVKTRATVYASHLRDFILHDYNKTYLDKAAGYFMPFHYWTDRTYARYFERFLEDPKYIHAYLVYKDAMNKENGNLPEWWRYNLQITGLPGLQFDHPLFFNFEAALNPLNGLTGTDFNDPYKRVDWLSSTVDDLSKFGFNFTTPIQWAVAVNLYRKGEQDAAARWFGRLFPQTTQIKAATSLAIGKPVELDPFVNLFSGGTDPYERNRVARTLSGLVGTDVMINGQIQTVSREMAIDAANTQQGALWDEAKRLATNERAPWEIISFFAGLSFKGRTQADMNVDKFYGQYHQLLAAKSMMSPDSYKASWDALREQYPFMDTLLIGKRAGPERDVAFTYNVLGRIPPGSINDITSIVGIDSNLLSKFYDQKGSFDGWTPQEKSRFMAGIADLSAMLAMPDGATKTEWNAARSAYSEMNSLLDRQYGADIQDKISAYYDLRQAQRSTYLLNNPDVQAALNDRTAYIQNTRVLSAYYGGLDTLERYYSSAMYTELSKTYGPDIQDVVNQYYDLKIYDYKSAKELYNQRNLRGYFKDLARMKPQVNANINKAVQQLPQGSGFGIRPDFMPQSQEQMNALQATQPKTWQDFQQVLSPTMQELVYQYWTGGQDNLPNAVMNQLNYLAPKQGYSDGEEMLRAIGMTIR